MVCRLLLLVPLATLLGSAGTRGQADPYRMHLFSAPDRRVVVVGEAVAFDVEAVAVPETDEAAEALVAAFARTAFPAEVAGAFEVVRAEDPEVRRRAGTRIVELHRRFLLRPRKAGALTVPALPISLDGAAYATRPHTLRAYVVEPGLDPAGRAVVPLVAEGRVDGRALRRIGSGFFVAEDALVTAYHVVLDAERVRLVLPDGRRVTTNRAWAIDPARDVAVLYVAPRAVQRAGVVPLALADRFDPDLLGDDEDGVTFTAGWPAGVQQPSRGVRYPGLRFGTADLLRVSSNPVRPGDSGGPLLDARGRVLGVVSSGRSTGGVRDVLREDLCLATDPRRALAGRLAQPRPVSLSRALRDAALAPNAAVLQAASLLQVAPPEGLDPDRQLARIGEAARRAPGDAALQFLAGSVFQAYGADAQAADAYQAALNGAADYFPAVYALGHVHFEQGAYDRAEALFERTRAFAPYARLGAFGLARVHTARLEYAAAAEDLAEVLDHDPDFAPALYLLGYGLLAEGRVVEAEALAVRLDRIDPSWADALRLHGRQELLRPAALAALPRADMVP